MSILLRAGVDLIRVSESIIPARVRQIKISLNDRN